MEGTMTITPGTEYESAHGGYFRVFETDGGRVRFEVLDEHRETAGGVFTMEAAAFARLIEDGPPMRTPEETAGDYLAEYERRAEPPREDLPAAIRSAWISYTNPETPAEVREALRVALDEMTLMLIECE